MREYGCKKESNAYWAWLAVVLFYAYQYMLRSSMGIMIHDFRQEFDLTASEFSTLGAWNLYVYALLQIPVGIIIDRVGVRKTVMASILFCIGAELLLAISQGLWMAQSSRALLGIGSACAFIACLKVIADRLPVGKKGLFIGMTLALGTLGPLIAGKPQVHLIEAIGWRGAVFLRVGVGCLILLLVYFLVQRHEKGKPTLQRKPVGEIIDSIWAVLKNYRIMLYAVIAVGLCVPLAVLADAWGPAFIGQKFQLVRADAAYITMMMYLGLAVGSLILPGLCERKNCVDFGIQLSGLCLMFLLGGLLYLTFDSKITLTLLLLALGFFCGGEMLCFTGVAKYAVKDNSGITMGIVNTFNTLGGSVLIWAIGHGLDLRSSAQPISGLRVYALHDYVAVLTILEVVIIICCFLSLLLFKKRESPSSEPLK